MRALLPQVGSLVPPTFEIGDSFSVLLMAHVPEDIAITIQSTDLQVHPSQVDRDVMVLFEVRFYVHDHHWNALVVRRDYPREHTILTLTEEKLVVVSNLSHDRLLDYV
jgi:hypothetical protein